MKYAALAIILIAISFFLESPLQAQTVGASSTLLPTLGDGGEMSSSAERRLGDRIAREIYRDPDYLDDPVLVGIRDVLLGLDIDVLTPVEALVKLHEIRSVLTGKK